MKPSSMTEVLLQKHIELSRGPKNFEYPRNYWKEDWFRTFAENSPDFWATIPWRHEEHDGP
jgi:hypothetical protein